MGRFFPAFLFLLCAVSCKAPDINKSDGYIIRYINLEVVYEYELARSNEAIALRNKKDGIIKKIREKELSSSYKPGDDEMEYYRSELVRITDQEKKLKADIYIKIKDAVETVSKKYDVDFLLNTGEGVVYSRPVFDLTAEVVTELEKKDKNSSTIWK